MRRRRRRSAFIRTQRYFSIKDTIRENLLVVLIRTGHGRQQVII